MCGRLLRSSVESARPRGDTVDTLSAHHAPTLRTVDLRAALAVGAAAVAAAFGTGYVLAQQLDEPARVGIAAGPAAPHTFGDALSRVACAQAGAGGPKQGGGHPDEADPLAHVTMLRSSSRAERHAGERHRQVELGGELPDHGLDAGRAADGEAVGVEPAEQDGVRAERERLQDVRRRGGCRRPSAPSRPRRPRRAPRRVRPARRPRRRPAGRRGSRRRSRRRRARARAGRRRRGGRP